MLAIIGALLVAPIIVVVLCASVVITVGAFTMLYRFIGWLLTRISGGV